MISIAVVDDNREDLDWLCAMLRERYAGAASVHAFPSAQAILNRFEDGLRVDIIFLDILMPDMTGTDLASALRDLGFEGPIIFLTASNHFAAEAFAVKAHSYLLKPITREKLDEALDALEETLRAVDTAGITLRTRQMVRRIALRDLLYVEVRGNRVSFSLAQGETIAISGALKDYAPTLLADRRFAKCHGSFIVNMDWVQALQGHDIILQNGTHIPIARRYADFKRRYIGHFVRADG